MLRHVQKALTHPLMPSKDEFGDQCSDIVAASGGCGYAALHNTMRLVHHSLSDKVVDTAIPYQGNTVTFASRVRSMAQFLSREKLSGLSYTNYEAIVMTLETLKGRFRIQMKHMAGIEFENGHNNLDNTPSKLDMSNIATELTSWAKCIRLEAPRGSKGDKITHLSSESNFLASDGLYAMVSDKTCCFCSIGGHSEDNCQLFINFLMASRFSNSILIWWQALSRNKVRSCV
jgi:hypothetical protein